ncbi:hypothetical protein [Piscirickettsia salmonis]|uniref:hypothetical protein n=1 Tax=Piscirickettsia salmonis TaxID=1238 RepID=UPI001013D4BF|nr:hypothetical protein [Piscirickettsia salmonis]QNR80900.1 hypothetical protein ICC15_02420 [Piscirickettsia salmonis]WGZ72053.1 hypothetical protein E3220_10885 [Piscirickettsia salmonis EM-90]
MAQESAYRSISKPKGFADPMNNAKRIIIKLAYDPESLLAPGLIVLDCHLTVPSFFRKRPDHDSTQLQPLQGHAHWTLKYKEHTDRPQDPPNEARLYYRYQQQGQPPEIGLVDYKNGRPLSAEVEGQLKEQAIAFMMPLITEVDRFLQAFEKRKANLEREITEANTQLSTATGLSEKLSLALKLRDLYKQWLQLIGEENYKHVKNLRNNVLSRTDEDGFTVQSASGRLTKGKLDEIWRVAAKAAMSGLRDIADQLKFEQAQSSEGHAAATSAAPKQHGKHGKKSRRAKKASRRGKGKADQRPERRQKENLEIYFKRNDHFLATFLQLEKVLIQGDLARFDQLLQEDAFNNTCILFSLSSEALKELCRPEKIAFLKSIISTQKDALILGVKDHKTVLVDMFKSAIEFANVELLLELNKLKLNADEILFEETRKSLLHHLVDSADQFNNEDACAWLLSTLDNQGFRCRHTQKTATIDFHDNPLQLTGLQLAAWQGFTGLARCAVKIGARDNLARVHYRHEGGQQETYRITATDFVVAAYLQDDGSSKREELYELLLVLCSSHSKREVSHILASNRVLWFDAIKDKRENELEKTLHLISLSSTVASTDLYKQKSEAEFGERAYAIYDGAIKTFRKQRSHAEAHQDQHSIVLACMGEAVAWLTLLRVTMDCNICHNPTPGATEALTRQLLRGIGSLRKEYRPGMEFKTDLDILPGRGKSGGGMRFDPDHIMEIVVGLILQLQPKSDFKQVIAWMQRQVLVGLKGEEFEKLKNVRRHVQAGFDTMPTERPVNTALARRVAQSQSTEDETKVDDATDDPRMLFLQHQQEANDTGIRSVQEYECG